MASTVRCGPEAEGGSASSQSEESIWLTRYGRMKLRVVLKPRRKTSSAWGIGKRAFNRILPGFLLGRPQFPLSLRSSVDRRSGGGEEANIRFGPPERAVGGVAACQAGRLRPGLNTAPGPSLSLHRVISRERQKAEKLE